MENTDSKARLVLYGLLKQRAGIEVVKESVTRNQLRLMCRLPSGHWNLWSPIVWYWLNHQGEGWSCDISKVYVVDGEVLRYAWRIILQGQDIESHIPEIVDVVSRAPRPTRVELTEQPLPGYRPGQKRRALSSKGKGAQSVFSAVTGAAAARRLNDGGQ